MPGKVNGSPTTISSPTGAGKPGPKPDTKGTLGDAERDNGDSRESGPVIVAAEPPVIEPATVPIAGTDPSGAVPRKRGRPPGARNAATIARTAEAPQSAKNLSEKISLKEILYNTHQMLAMVVDIEEIELDRDEAERLADAAQEVGKYYAVNFDPKKLAIFNLIQCAGVIYGTRFVAWRRKQAAKPAPAKPAPAPAAAAAPMSARPGAGTPAVFGVNDGTTVLDPGTVTNPSQLNDQSGVLTGHAMPL